ncbi:MAG: YkgJ family cysteine cluster protein [Treponemataceae bacterium]|nr:MAG: YkgJ family cysteine cluster protein [Treponemataceae bacterium]
MNTGEFYDILLYMCVQAENLGVYFSCARCSSCCRYESGFVYLSENDLAKLCRFSGMEKNEFIPLYCRWAPYYDAFYALSLKEKSNYDCVFYDEASGGCAVYAARPVQCETYPFWTHITASKKTWEESAAHCPGMREGLNQKGAFYAAETVALNTERYKTNVPVLRKG